MCGIVGAVGHERCGLILLDALKRLEYRGYDSTGISIYNGTPFYFDYPTVTHCTVELSLYIQRVVGHGGDARGVARA